MSGQASEQPASAFSYPPISFRSGAKTASQALKLPPRSYPAIIVVLEFANSGTTSENIAQQRRELIRFHHSDVHTLHANWRGKVCGVAGQPHASPSEPAREPALKTDDGAPRQAFNAALEQRRSLGDQRLELTLVQNRRHAPFYCRRYASFEALGREMSKAR